MALNVTSLYGMITTGSGIPNDPYRLVLTGATQIMASAIFTSTTDGTCYLEVTGISEYLNDHHILVNNSLVYSNPTYVYDLLGFTASLPTNGTLDINIPTSPSGNTYFQALIYFIDNATPPPAVPYSLYVIDQPALTTSGQLLSPQPSIGIKDQYGTVLTNFDTDVQVSLVVLSGSATLTGTTTVSTVNGVATFNDLVITGNGLFYLQFDSTILALNSVNSNQLFFPPDAGNPNPPIPVKPKRSYIAGSVPAYTDLEINEFAINVADRKGYMRDSNDIVHLLFDGYASGGGGSGGTVYSVGVSSTDLDVSNSPITTSGFIGLDLKTQSLTAATYGDASNVAEVTVNDKGIVTGIQNVAISYPVNSITAGTDISLTGTAPDYTINNTAPDQIVSITSGTGISVTGTYPNFTIDSTITQYTDADARLSLSAGTGISYDNTTGVITNSEPDQIVGLTGGTDISVTGTYPNFTIDYTGTNTGVTSIIAGTGISVDQATGAVTVTNTDPDQVVLLTAGAGISVTGTYPNFTIDSTITQYTDADARLSLSAGTGISYDNTTGVITNSDPDQIVSLTGGTDIGVTGTYPNFTIDYTGTAGTGTVTSVGITSTAAALTITNSPITTSGDIGVNFAGKGSEYVTGDGSLKTFPTTIDQALNLVTEVYNSTGSTLTKGTVVYINGGQGNLPTVTKAQANSDANSAQTYGVVQADITNNNNGYVVVIGRLTDIDTQAYSTGTQLYLSPTTAGAWTTTKPSAPSHLVYVGIVVYSHPTQGVVEIKIQNGYELDEIHDVSITNVASNNILRYNSSTKLWENVAGTTSSISEGTNLYYTDSRARLSLSAGTGISYNNTTGVITNSSPDQTVVLTAGTGISTSGTYPNFTITNSAPDQTVKLTAGAGISTSGTYPNFTITNSSPDQTVTLTAGSGISVTGTYPSFTIGSTITQYTDTDARKSISAGTGISYDNTTGVITNDAPDQTVSLTAGTDISVTGTYPNFTIDYTGTSGVGTVTSVGLSAPTGMIVTNSPITSSGTIALSMDTGYALPTSASQTNWDSAYTATSNATNANTASTIVARDASGNFSAGTITASLSGNATNVTGTVAIANGGTGATNSSTARSNLGLVIGTNVQAYSLSLAFIASLSGSSGLLRKTGTTSWTLDTTSYLYGTVGIGNGGTGQTTQQGAINALTGTQSSGKYLRSDGTNSTLSSIQAADVPTLNQNTTGNASTATSLAGGGAGQLPYNTGSGATSFLAAGTSGQILRSNGSSAPTWEVQGLFHSGRLTLESNVPVSTTDQTSKTTIYYTPYNGDKISLYDGTNWATYTFSQLSLALGTLSSGFNYDVFVYNNAGTLTLETAVWTNDTTRATSLTLTNGIYLKTGALTRRYLGTFRTTSTTATEDSLAKRYVWNFNNKVLRSLYVGLYIGLNHTYNGNAREWNNGTNVTRLQFITGIDGETFIANGVASITSGGFACNAYFGVDSTTAQFGATTTDDRAAVFTRRSLTTFGQINSGYHYMTMIQSTESAGTSTFLDVTVGGALMC